MVNETGIEIIPGFNFYKSILLFFRLENQKRTPDEINEIFKDSIKKFLHFKNLIFLPSKSNIATLIFKLLIHEKNLLLFYCGIGAFTSLTK